MEEAHGPLRRELLLAVHHVDNGNVVRPGYQLGLARREDRRAAEWNEKHDTHRRCCENNFNKPLASSPKTCQSRVSLFTSSSLQAAGKDPWAERRRLGDGGREEESRRRCVRAATRIGRRCDQADGHGVRAETAVELTSSVRRESSGPLGRDIFVAPSASWVLPSLGARCGLLV